MVATLFLILWASEEEIPRKLSLTSPKVEKGESLIITVATGNELCSYFHSSYGDVPCVRLHLI